MSLHVLCWGQNRGPSTSEWAAKPRTVQTSHTAYSKHPAFLSSLGLQTECNKLSYVMAHFMYQLGWTLVSSCWSISSLDVPAKVFLEVIHIFKRRWLRAEFTSLCGWDLLHLLKTLRVKTGVFSKKEFCLKIITQSLPVSTCLPGLQTLDLSMPQDCLRQSLKILGWNEKMAQWMNWLPHKLKDLRPNPQDPYKVGHDTGMQVCNLRVPVRKWGAETGEPPRSSRDS